MVDAIPVSPGHRQHVLALAVGVVDDHVEDRHPAQRHGVLVDQRHRQVAAVDPVEDVSPAGRHLALRHQGHGVLSAVDLLPALHHAPAVRAVAQPGLGNDVPAQRLGDEVRRPLRPARSPSGKSHSGSLAGDRLQTTSGAVLAAMVRGTSRWRRA